MNYEYRMLDTGCWVLGLALKWCLGWLNFYEWMDGLSDEQEF